MKTFLAISACFLTASFTASAQMISASSFGAASVMPGSATDYTFFGNANQFPDDNNYYGKTTQPTVLNDFTVAHGANGSNTFQGDSRYSVINGPVGSGQTNVQTGILFNGGNSPDMVDFTLKSGTGYDFSNFNAYVMYGNGYGDGGVRDTSLTATLLSSTGFVLKTVTATIMDIPSGSNGNADPVADFELFHVTGAAAGDVLRFGADGATTYLGGVSFSEAPEPMTWVMMAGALVLLVGINRFRQRA